MITRTIKIPKSLVDKIDALIRSNEYSTRTDFVLHAMRETLIVYANKKKELIEKSGDVLNGETLVSSLYSTITDTYLRGFNEYDGQLIQINVRVPDGLDDKITFLIKPEYGFKKKADYIRASIMCLISILGDVEEIFADAEKFAARQKQLSEMLNKIVLQGLNEGKKMDEIVKDAFDQLKKSNIE